MQFEETKPCCESADFFVVSGIKHLQHRGHGEPGESPPDCSVFLVVSVVRFSTTQAQCLLLKRETAMRIDLLSLLLVALGVSTNTFGQDVVIPKDKESFHLVLLIGQSNMAGRGKVEEQDTKIHPRVLTLNKENEWVSAKDPLHFDKPKIVGVGLGRTFGMDYAAKHPNVTIGLVPCAVGGSPISAWEPRGYHSTTKTHPYDETLPRIRHAMKTGTLKAILWHQGESDSNPDKAAVYEERLHALIGRLREQFKAPNVPFVLGQMGQFPERPWNAERKLIDTIHQRVPSAIPNTAFANSNGLSHRGDKVHFDSKSYRKLGHRYFAAFESIQRQPSPVLQK